MNDDFGEMLIGAMEEAVAYKQGRLRGVRVDRLEHTARETKVAPPPSYDADRIQRIRSGLKVSQPVFAGMLNVSSSTVQAWEQGVREPEGASLRLLEIAETRPDALLERALRPNGTPQG